MRHALLVAVGGACGALLRVALASATPVDGAWPWSTLLVNVGGALGLGALVGFLSVRPDRGAVLRPLLAAGFFGALTTFSTFALQVMHLAADDHLVAAAAYTAATVGVGLGAATVGLRLGRLG